MGIDAVRIGVEIRRLLVVSVRSCYRTICRHPFLVGMACFLMLLYRSFPFLFSILVSTSPVLVCTAVLLGTLLSFGNPNLPEIEEDEGEEGAVSHEVSELKSGIVEDATVVVRDESFSVDRFTQEREGAEEKVEDERNLVEKEVSTEVHDDGFGDFMPLINSTSRDIHFEKGVIEEVERGLDASEKKRESQVEMSRTKEVLGHDEVSGNQYTLVSNVEDDENLEDGNDKLLGEFAEDKEGYHLDFLLHRSSRQANDDDHERGEDEDASDSGSDGAESSSPDASISDILPLLDELHPLLNEEAPQPGHVSDDGSDANLEWSHKSKEGNVESDDDLERHANEVDDNDNEEEEEESQRGKEDDSKAAIKWTEDDQKNLMDLGTSELERNQRLESLIARRRARKNMRLMAERNLIDLDGFDLPLNVPTISTARHNPFDLPYDDDVPGSAPSILMPRRNPFDLPYDSSEEKPDLKGDSFQQEFSAVQHREHVFRRHESFNVGPSGLGFPRQERQALRWKPYFVPERFGTEGTSYHTFERQLSEVSESKLSSVPDTDSVNSAIDEDKKLNEEDVSQGTEVTSNIDLASILVERGSISSEDVNSAYFERVEERDEQLEEDEITLGDVENHHECDSGLPPSPSELNASEILRRMGAGDEEYSSRSSLSSLSEIDEKIADVKNESTSAEQITADIGETYLSTQNSLDSDFQFMSGKADEYRQSEPVLVQTSDFHFTVGVVEHISEPQRDDIGDSGISNQTTLESESRLVNAVENEKQEEFALEAREFNCDFFRQTSLESDYNSTSRGVDEVQHKEPTYDLSPSRTDKIISLTSVSSDILSETLVMSSAPEVTEYANVESAVRADRMEQDSSGDGEMHESCSQVGLSCDKEPRPEEGTEIREGDDTRAELSGSDADFDGQYVHVNTESVVEQVVVDSLASSSNSESVTEDVPVMEESWHHKQPQVDLLNLDRELIVETHKDETKLQDVVIKPELLHHEELQLDSSNLDGDLITDAPHDEMEKPDSGFQFQMPSELDEQHSLVLVENDSADLRLSSSVSESLNEHPVAVEETLHVVEDQVHISTTGALNGCETETLILDPAASSVDVVHSVDVHMSAHEEREPQLETIYSVEDQVHLSSSGTSNGFVTETEKLDPVASVDIVPSADLHVSAYEERKPQLEEVQFSEAHTGISSLNAHHEERDSFIKEESTQIEPDQVLSSSSTTEDNVADIHQDVNVEDLSMPLKKSSQNELENQQSPSDNSIFEPSFDVQNLSLGRNEQLELSAEQTSVDDLEAYHTKDNTSGNITPLISDTKCAAHENLEYESKIGTLDLNVNLLDEIVYENSDHVIEHSPVTEGNVNEMESEIKDIDEGLLSELDTVGDFCVKEADSEMIVSEHILETGTRSTEFDSLMHNLSLADIRPELPVLELKSVEDIELAFRQIHEVTDVEEVILPSMEEEQVVVEQFEDHTERISDIHFVEASSLADIDIAMKQFSQGSAEEQPATLHLENEPEKINEMNTSKELPVLEVKTVEDIDLAFKQLHEGADVEEIILPSTIEQQLSVEEPRDLGQTSSELQIVEARSIDNIQLAIKQLSQIDVEKQANTSVTDSVEEIEVGSHKEAESRTLDATDVSSSSNIEPNSEGVAETNSVEEHDSTAVESTVNETITDVPHKPDHVSDEASENLTSSIPDKKEKKKKSHKRSGSSSSSSSSDSD